MAAGAPVYDWDYATPGDEAGPVTVEVTADKVRKYVAALADRNPALVDGQGMPPVMVRVYAPLRRRELVAEKGALYPDHPTPAVHWRSRVLTDIRVGDRITSITRVKDKYLKNGRHFLAWEVEARRGDQTVALFDYVNLWDRGRPEDRRR